jgi:hypothetical protein
LLDKAISENLKMLKMGSCSSLESLSLNLKNCQLPVHMIIPDQMSLSLAPKFKWPDNTFKDACVRLVIAQIPLEILRRNFFEFGQKIFLFVKLLRLLVSVNSHKKYVLGNFKTSKILNFLCACSTLMGTMNIQVTN